MKILYQIHSTYNPGGMERVLLNKMTWLVEKKGWDVTVVKADDRHVQEIMLSPHVTEETEEETEEK